MLDNILNHNKTLSYCRDVAANNGLTFKVDKTLIINGFTAYKFINRKSGLTVMSNCTIGSAFENVESGYIDSWNGEQFEGINQ
jgi:hypothetical protein